MMLDPPRLRRARAEDAATAAPLLVQALDVLALELAGVECLEAAVPLFHELFRLPGNRYSHAHAWVLDGTAGVVGVLLAYPGRDEALLAEATLDWLRARAPGRALVHQPESDPGEFYLDALAVAGSQRGRGLAAMMIDGLCDAARQLGHARVGLLVDDAKPRVRALYERLGFVDDGRREVAGHAYAHMTRVLPARTD